MNNVINITDFRNNIGTYIDKIIYQNETFYIKKGKSVVAKVIQATESPKKERTSPLLKLAGLWSNADAAAMKKIYKTLDKKDHEKLQKLIKHYAS